MGIETFLEDPRRPKNLRIWLNELTDTKRRRYVPV